MALLAALLIGLVIGIPFGEPLENAMKIARSKLRDHPASGEIVLVAIDDRSLAEWGPAPWTGDRLAELLARVDSAAPRRVHLDSELPASAGPDADAVERTLARMTAEVTLPARFSINSVTGERRPVTPPSRFARHASLVNTNLYVWWDDTVWQHPAGARVGNRTLPSLSSALAGDSRALDHLFPLDHSVDVRSIPVISAGDILGGRAMRQDLTGKQVVIARTDLAVESYRTPGTGRVAGVFFHILGAETLLQGQPVNLGWLVAFAVAGLLAWGVLKFRRSIALLLLGVALAGFFVVPLVLEMNQIHAQVVPGFVTIMIAVCIRLTLSLRRSYQARGTTNIVTGMPNLQALRNAAFAGTGAVIVARIKNYAQIATTLPPPHEKDLVDQIVARLKFGTGSSTIYQADDGVFAWVSEQDLEESVLQQLEGLHALFRSPIVIATRIIDVAVAFGLDPDPSRSLTQRVSSALVAADEAARDGKRWASFNPASLQDAEWTMSLLARLDHAIDHGELWVAYQPKLDCRTGEIIGAEALVRWTHPEKGQVYPEQFIAAAEQGGRIERLTYFVLDTALAAAARINEGSKPFRIAVNLSAVLLGNDTLIPAVQALLRKHELDPSLLILEVTETSTLGGEAGAIANLRRLSDMGVQLSIDDYGTGFSTLEYLRRIPASEIKIDRSFITMLHNSQSDRIMVNSTIQLAHSLGRIVVAEGVETEEILDQLRRMNCDVVQGYHTGRPAPLEDLLERLGLTSERRAA